MKLNRDAQLNVLDGALPCSTEGARVVFVTSHQAHFIRTVETMPEYVPVALRSAPARTPCASGSRELEASGIGFVVVSGDMIEGTITATLLERANPGAIRARKDAAGKLYNVAEFAAEVALAAVEAIPADHTRYVGDIADFGGRLTAARVGGGCRCGLCQVIGMRPPGGGAPGGRAGGNGFARAVNAPARRRFTRGTTSASVPAHPRRPSCIDLCRWMPGNDHRRDDPQ